MDWPEEKPLPRDAPLGARIRSTPATPLACRRVSPKPALRQAVQVTGCLGSSDSEAPSEWPLDVAASRREDNLAFFSRTTPEPSAPGRVSMDWPEEKPLPRDAPLGARIRSTPAPPLACRRVSPKPALRQAVQVTGCLGSSDSEAPSEWPLDV